MALEDFEKALVEERRKGESGRSSKDHNERSRHHRHHRHRGHHYEDEETNHRHKRRKHSRDDGDKEIENFHNIPHYPREAPKDETSDKEMNKRLAVDPATTSPSQGVAQSSIDSRLQRDSWMKETSGLDVEYSQKCIRQPSQLSQAVTSTSQTADLSLKVHDNELNKLHLQRMADGRELPEEIAEEHIPSEVNYKFGDAGAQWRMTKLKGIYRKALETGDSVEKVAEEHYGDLRGFDDAREEQIELERRETYGDGYLGREKPKGDLYAERKLDAESRSSLGGQNSGNTVSDKLAEDEGSQNRAKVTSATDQTALNRLKAQMMKSKLRGSPNAINLEVEYDSAVVNFTKKPDTIVLGTMDNRMLAGGRNGEVTNINNTRGRERGLVEENEDMSIDDMVKQERRTRNQAGGDGQRFAERIAKDAKFDVCVS